MANGELIIKCWPRQTGATVQQKKHALTLPAESPLRSIHYLPVRATKQVGNTRDAVGKGDGDGARGVVQVICREDNLLLADLKHMRCKVHAALDGEGQLLATDHCRYGLRKFEQERPAVLVGRREDHGGDTALKHLLQVR